MNWGWVLGGWLTLMAIETLHGTIRAMVVTPVVGDLASRQIGVCLGVLINAWITFIIYPFLRSRDDRTSIFIGLIWIVLTMIFELTIGRLLGVSWERLLADYDVLHGGLLGFGLGALMLSPLLASRLHQRRNERGLR